MGKRLTISNWPRLTQLKMQITVQRNICEGSCITFTKIPRWRSRRSFVYSSSLIRHQHSKVSCQNLRCITSLNSKKPNECDGPSFYFLKLIQNREHVYSHRKHLISNYFWLERILKNEKTNLYSNEIQRHDVHIKIDKTSVYKRHQ